MFTNIFLRLLFCVMWLSETILCVRDMYAVVLQRWINIHICVKYAWLCSGTYSVHTGMYFEISYIRVHTGMYRYIPVQTRYIPKTRFLYHWSRFQMWQCFGSKITLQSRYVSVSVCVRMCTYVYVLCMFVYVSVCMCTYYVCKKELSFISNRQRQITVVSLLWVRTGKVPDVDTHTTYTYRLSLHWVTA